MSKDEIMQLMADAGLKTPARGDFIFIHWDQIAMLLAYERKRMFATDECLALAHMLGKREGRMEERKLRPNLGPVINWLESGCDPKDAAKELRIYQERMK